MEKTTCPVCNYNLWFKPWENEIASDEICPSCGIHFGYDDAKKGVFREWVYHWWKNKWKLDGKKLWSNNIK